MGEDVVDDSLQRTTLLTDTLPGIAAAPDGGGQGGVPHLLQAHIPPLDGLRGLAALMVVFAHLQIIGLKPILEVHIGAYGVFLFFTLSGFLMGHLYLPKTMTYPRVSTYLAARISRIVPLYYAAVLAGFVVGKLVDPAFPYAMSGAVLVRHLFFVGSVSNFWSIGPEFQFYFLFPLLWGIMSKPATAALRWGIPAIGLVLAILVFRYQVPGILVFSKIHIFLAGICVALIRPWVVDHIEEQTAVTAQIIAIVFLLALLLPGHIAGSAIYPDIRGDVKQNPFYQDFGKLLPLCFVVFAFTFETRLSMALFANRFAKLIGKYSFSIYLLHVPVMYTLGRLGVYAALPEAMSLPLALIAVMLSCTLSFNLLEEPSRVWSRDMLLRLFAMLRGTAAPRGTARI